ncbi:hypothetical protein ABZP36_011914 [Zizania latifolia]
MFWTRDALGPREDGAAAGRPADLWAGADTGEGSRLAAGWLAIDCLDTRGASRPDASVESRINSGYPNAVLSC